MGMASLLRAAADGGGRGSRQPAGNAGGTANPSKFQAAKGGGKALRGKGKDKTARGEQSINHTG